MTPSIQYFTSKEGQVGYLEIQKITLEHEAAHDGEKLVHNRSSLAMTHSDTAHINTTDHTIYILIHYIQRYS